MALRKFKVMEKSYINNTIAEEGEIVEYDGEPSENLVLLDETPTKKTARKSDDSDAV